MSNRFGFGLVIAYMIFAAGAVGLSLAHTQFSQAYLLPAMPWAALVSTESNLAYAILILFNASVLFVVGYMLDRALGSIWR